MSTIRLGVFTIVLSAIIGAFSIALFALPIRTFYGLGYIDSLEKIGHDLAHAFIYPNTLLVSATCLVLWSVSLGLLIVMLSMRAMSFRLRVAPALGVVYTVGALFVNAWLRPFFPFRAYYVVLSLCVVCLYCLLLVLWLHQLVHALRPRITCHSCGYILRGLCSEPIPSTLTEALAGPRTTCPECGAQSRIDTHITRR